MDQELSILATCPVMIWTCLDYSKDPSYVTDADEAGKAVIFISHLDVVLGYTSKFFVRSLQAPDECKSTTFGPVTKPG